MFRDKLIVRDVSLYNFFVGSFYLTVSVLFFLALISYSSGDPSFSNAVDGDASNILGKGGAYVIDFLLQTIGCTVALLILVPFVWGIRNILGYNVKALWFRFILFIATIVSFSGFLYHTEVHHIFNLQMFSSGGVLGNLIHSHLYTILTKKVLLYTSLTSTMLLLYLTLDIRMHTIYACLKVLIIFLYRLIVCGIQFLGKYLWQKSVSFVTENKDDNECLQKIEKKEHDFIEIFKKKVRAKKEMVINNKRSEYSIPETDLLRCYKQNKGDINTSTLKNNAQELIKVLRDFGVHGKINNYFSGPVVTLYELEPAAGTKSARVIGLSDDIARTMKALSARVSIMLGRNSLGIELPNPVREIVYLKELVESKEYVRDSRKLSLVLGKDIGGNTTIADLCEMPHLLVAGTTGSGKSVAINTMILSLLFNHTPDTCKFIMIDPKMLELSVYEGIPHLLAPVVTESHKAISTLKWVVKEMENRYRLMSYLGVRNIHSYNQKILKEGNIDKKIQIGFEKDTGNPIYNTVNVDGKTLPFIVVVVDEMADLMIVSGKEIESSIQRLAQMARAAGIHIIMATQRPSVDVITGVIKANFSTRIAFQVSSKIDSRTILGESGAEQLLGKGDMLYLSGGNKIKRIHSPFVDDNEVMRVVSFWKSQGAPNYRKDILLEDGNPENSFGISENCKDELYEQAVSLVKREKKVSTSYIQRVFKIGYNRAASIVEQMEKEGLVSCSNHVGKREVLIDE